MRGISTLQPGSLACFHALLAENEMEEDWRVNTGNVITHIMTKDMILLGLNVQSELIRLSRSPCLLCFLCISNKSSADEEDSRLFFGLWLVSDLPLFQHRLKPQSRLSPPRRRHLCFNSSNIPQHPTLQPPRSSEFPSSSSQSCFNSSHVAAGGGVKLIQNLRAWSLLLQRAHWVSSLIHSLTGDEW